MTYQTVAEWLAAGNKITRCPTVHLVRTQQPDELPKDHVPPTKAKRPRGGGGGWASYWAKQRARMGVAP